MVVDTLKLNSGIKHRKTEIRLDLRQQDPLWALPLDQNQQTFFVDRIRALDHDT